MFVFYTFPLTHRGFQNSEGPGGHGKIWRRFPEAETNWILVFPNTSCCNRFVWSRVAGSEI